jgi:TP901 family phage tail tape measure protein
MATLGEAVIKVIADLSNFTANMNKAGAQMKAFGQGVQKVGSSLTAVGVAAATAGAALLAMWAPAIIAGAQFEQSMAGVKAVMGDLQSGTELATQNFERLNEKAKELGSTTKFSASQVAEAMEFLGLAGFTTEQALTGVGDVLALASAGALDLARASDIASDSMSAFGLTAADIGRVADVFAAAAAASNTSVEQLSEAMKFGAPVAAGFGQSIEETAAAMGILANQGIKGSAAGTAIGQVFANLASRMENADEVLRQYGSSFDAVDPSIRSLSEIVDEFRRINIDAADSMNILGIRGGRAMLALQNASKTELGAVRDAINGAAGAAERMAAIRFDTVQGNFIAFKSAVEGLQVSVFESIAPVLREVIKTSTEVVNRIKAWVEANQPLVQQIFKITTGIGSFLLALGLILIPLGFIITQVGAVIATLGALAAQVTVVGAAIAAGIGAVAIPIIAAFIANWDKLAKAFNALWIGIIKPVIDGLREGFASAWNDFLKPAFDALKTAIGELIDIWVDLFGVLGEGESIWKNLANILAQVLVFAISAVLVVIRALVEIGKVASQIYVALADVMIAAARAMGFISKETKTLTEAQEDQAKQLAEFEKGVKGVADGFRNKANAAKLAQAEDQKAIQLLEKQDKLGGTQLNQLKKLQEAGRGGVATIKERLAVREQEIVLLDRLIAKGKEAGADVDFEIKTREKILAERDKELKLLERIGAVEQKFGGGAAGREKEKTRLEEVNKALKERESVLIDQIEREVDAGRAAGKFREELAKLQQQLQDNQAAVRSLNDIEKNFGDQQLTNAAATGARLEQLAKEKEIRKAAADAEKAQSATRQKIDEIRKGIEAARAASLKNELTQIEDTRIASQNLIQTRRDEVAAIQAQDRMLGKHNELLEKERIELDGLSKAIDQNAAKQQEAARARLSEGREDTLRTLKIQQAERNKDAVGAERLRLQKEKENFEKHLDEVFQLDGKNNERILKQRSEAIDLFNREQRAKLGEAFKQQDKGQIVQVAEREADLEGKILDKLVGQVKNVQQLFQLYTAIAIIRNVQEQRAIQAAERAAAAEQRLARFQERRGRQAGANPVLDQQIAKAERTVKLLDAIAGKRAGEAQLGDVAANQAIQELEVLRQKLFKIREAIAELRGQIRQELDNVALDFAAAPQLWVDAFIGAWAAAAQQIVAEVLATMAQVKDAMDPTLRQSPSLVDVWGKNVDTVKQGIARMGQAIQQNTPRLSALNASQAGVAAPVGLSAGGFTGAVQPRENNDNRRIDMQISNNVDGDNLQRIIAQGIGRANMLGGSI